MQVLQTLHYFVYQGVDQFRLQPVLKLLNQIQQIAFEVLEYEIDFSLLLESLLKADHVVPLEHLEHLDFALDGLAGKLVFVAFLELLYGHSVAA